MNDKDTLLTSRQLQELLQVDRITIYRMLNDGRLQGFKVGGHWRFSRQAIENWLQEQQAGLELAQPPHAVDELHPSAENLPLSCVQAIQDIFAESLEVGTITTLVDGTPLNTISHSCEFCDLILSTEAGRQRCIGAWRRATAAQSPQGASTQGAVCHAGLTYVWGRIQIRGELVAAIHAGQFLTEPPQNRDWSQRITELSEATGLEDGRLRDALAEVPVLDREKHAKVPRLLQRVAATFSEIGEERLNLLGRLQRIAEITQV
jgi:excisionase family DNA binding protein